MAVMGPKSTKPTDFHEQELLQRVRPDDWKNPAAKPLYDLVVVGGGPAGLAAAEWAVRLGLRVALVERRRLGGDSLNTGTIPSKAMIRTAGVHAIMPRAEDFGAPAAHELPVDFQTVMARMRRIRSRLAEYHSADRLRAQGVDVFFGIAHFAASDALLVGDTRLRFKKALVATGSQPQRSTIPGLEEAGYLTSESVFELASLPRRLVIIGGGPLGCEAAQTFSRLGTHVTLVQDEPKFLPHEERDASQLLSYSLARDGVDTRLNTAVQGVRVENGVKILDTLNDATRYRIDADEILLSIGRAPNVTDLGLAAAGIAFDPATGIVVDDFLRTTNPRVYAAGDVCLSLRFTNAAEATARMAVQNAFAAKRRRLSLMTIPWCTYCDPEIAHVGMHVWDASERSVPIKSFTVMMQDVARAITDGQDDGFVKIHVKLGTDRILGATIVASRASEMINEISVAMSTGIGMRKLARILHTYPAQSDAIRQAALAYTLDQPVSWLQRAYARWFA
jgi:pyruvate/2-oxoglutarate dehydrogenase complex dihydrolipoamide dehydrogenase (E3) component